MNFKLSRLTSNNPYYSSAMAMMFLGSALRMLKDAQRKIKRLETIKRENAKRYRPNPIYILKNKKRNRKN